MSDTQHPSEKLSLSELARRYDLTTDEMRRRLVECGMTVGGDRAVIDAEAAAVTLAERDHRITDEVVGRLLGDVPEDWAAQALDDAMGKLRVRYFGSRDSDELKQRFERMSRSCRLELDAKMPCNLRRLLLARTRAKNIDEQAAIELEIASEFDRWHADLAATLTVRTDPAPALDATQAAAVESVQTEAESQPPAEGPAAGAEPQPRRLRRSAAV